MSTPTYYTTLGLTPNAPPEVIRAAYKALCLISHPDKTINLPPQTRAVQAAAFNQIQAAYDVLGTPFLKASYDAELLRSESIADEKGIKTHRTPSQASSKPFWSSKDKTAVKLTTSEEKSASRTRARQSLENLRKKRAERDVRDSEADMASLKQNIQIWTELADENRKDPAVRAHCMIRIHEYEQKVARQIRQHEEWLVHISKAKQSSGSPKHISSISPVKATQARSEAAEYKLKTPPSSRSPLRSPYKSPTPIHRTTRVEQQKQTRLDREAAAAARAETRATEKSQRVVAKQARSDKKAAAVLAEKAKQHARTQAQAAKEAQRIASARAKAGAAPLGTVGAVVGRGEVTSDDAMKVASRPTTETTAPKVASCGSKRCSKCGLAHENFREWRACFSSASTAEKQTSGHFPQPE